MGKDILRTLALNKELSNAIRLIQSGLGQLQSLDGANDFYHLPILTLANGFERLMKAILCFRELEVSGQYPDRKFFQTDNRKGHNLELLLQRVKDECFLAEYVDKIPAASEDLEFLKSQELAEFVGILSRFGQSARYYYFDVVLGKEPQTGDPEAEWQQLETSMVLGRADFMERVEAGEVGNKVRTLIVGMLERFARALSRLFTIGRIGKEAQRHVGYVICFLQLRDSQLGQTRYNPNGRENC
ncbi:hypothetical protein [Marinobacter nauticus]|uniref:hypothetical protein n=1 Tax=Marinobacter nauticus TaxID=2743 RepID=UPI001C974FD9|nr:hypothetical protein [Marinobacter nauticus]MBY6220872.1 hypothetical protein [Marinobacter nauticus]